MASVVTRASAQRLTITCCSQPRPVSSDNPILTFKRSTLPLRALLALSAAGAVVYLRRSIRSPQKASIGKKLFMAAQAPERQEAWKIIDSHVHVWAPPEQTVAQSHACKTWNYHMWWQICESRCEPTTIPMPEPKTHTYPYFPGQEPTTPGSVEVLLQAMEQGSVNGALIVQPINHKFDHSYLSSVLQMYPNKFAGCCLANPAEGGSGVLEMERLVKEEGYRAVRFNPYLWESNKKMTNDVGKALFAKAGQLGIPVGFMCFKGLLLHIQEIEELCSEFQDTQVLLDHFGFCKPPVDDSEMKAWESLLRLSRYPQVYVKVSAFFRVSREPYPYKDTWPLLEKLVTVFGPKRLLWGSDFPFVVGESGYANARRVLDLAKDSISMTDEDIEWIMGRTALELFTGVWEKA